MSSIRALTFDFWDTIYVGEMVPERKARHSAVVRRLLEDLGHELGDDEFVQLIHESAREADRWWREEQRGYGAEERIRWMLGRLQIQRPEGCELIAAACAGVDEALLEHPPTMIDGARPTIEQLARKRPLAIISDTGFASGRAQDELLGRDGLLDLFAARIYSMDVGHAKPRREPFVAALQALQLKPGAVIHIGDNERTDVLGALNAGMRAVRVDFFGTRGPSAAEFVAASFAELGAYLVEEIEKGEAA